jgi:pyruvate formate lyase activating enzyme
MLVNAAAIAKASGLKYVYTGNLPGRVGDLENTRCHHCSALLIERYGYLIRAYRVTGEGTCPDCGTPIPGRWGRQFDGQVTATPFVPGTRRLKVI